ncbi:MAG: SDR family oxidoreductase [Candidatus Hydrogenedentes bacterium]|nr:SDR family oxidoreductase [Candidatus Hydrogenedentota bacterium]
MSFENKVVVVTGAGFPNGIGAGIARCFANEKAKVIITDLEGAPIDETIAAMSGDVSGLIADAASQEAMGKAAAQIVEEHGRIDVLVNNAGIGGPRVETDFPAGEIPGSSMSDQLWDRQLAANLRTTFASASAVAPKMEDGGSIVNIASVAALGPATGLPAYGAAKAAVVHLTKTHAIQFAPRRIRVNCICPGLLWTRAWEMMTDRMKRNNPDFANMSQRQIFEDIVARTTPLGAEQTPEDIGNLAVFYASDKARMITGAVVAVDGGSSL